MRAASRDAAIERYFVGLNEEFHPYRKEYSQEELELYKINFKSETSNDIVPTTFESIKKKNVLLAVLPPDASVSQDQVLGFVKLFVFVFPPLHHSSSFFFCYTEYHLTRKQVKLVFFFLLLLFRQTGFLLEECSLTKKMKE